MDKYSIITSFELDYKEVETNVFKITNTDKEVNIDKLQWALEDCILITSLEKRTEKVDSGIHTMIANVYYIILNVVNKDIAYKYDDIATEEFGRTLYKPYKYNPNINNSNDTIYKADEY